MLTTFKPCFNVVTNRNQPTTTRQLIMNEIMRQEHEAIIEWCHDVCDDMVLDSEFFGDEGDQE